MSRAFDYNSATILSRSGYHLSLSVYLPGIVMVPWCYCGSIVVQDQDTCRIPSQHQHSNCRTWALSSPVIRLFETDAQPRKIVSCYGDINFCISYMDMGFFSFFKKRNIETGTADRIALTPVGILQSLQDYIPELYKSRRPYVDYLEFLKHHEFGLALDSLIQLADESGHYFAEHFWLNLASCADKMGMSAEAEDCRQQIRRNKLDNVLVAKGHTVERAAGNVLVQHVSVAVSKKSSGS